MDFRSIAKALKNRSRPWVPGLKQSAVADWLTPFREILISYQGSVEEIETSLKASMEELGQLISLARKVESSNSAVQSDESLNLFCQEIPNLQQEFIADVEAAMAGDPAARSYSEVALSYPSILALTHHRVAHQLYLLGIPVLPRVISELAHSQTGIDIHPGARIGASCFIDHGTGVVIGETAVVGNRVTLYQGVTLGAKSFPRDGRGQIVKGKPRHPIIEDDVTIYSGASILGRIRVGEGSVIGGNVWLTRDVPPRSRVFQGQLRQEGFGGFGDGI